MHALTDGLHGLAGAGNPEGLLRIGNQQVLGNRPGLDATASTIQDPVAVRLGEKLQLFGERDFHEFGSRSALR